jgi:hypothetical protein
MKVCEAKRRGEKQAIPTNLTLSDEARKVGQELKRQLSRPSLSNVVETLILEKGIALGVVKAK